MTSVARSQARQRLGTLTGLVLLVGATALFFRGVLAGQRLFAVDFHLTFQPLRAVLGEMLNEGSAGWNPHLSNGVPLTANPLYAAYYPINNLFRFVPAAAGLTWLTVLHVLFGAVGTFGLCRRQGLLTAGALTAAAVATFGGVAASSTAYTNLCWSMSWMPWLFLGLERIRAAEKQRQALWGQVLTALAIAALVLLGEPFVLLAGILGGCLAIFENRGSRNRRDDQTRWRAIARWLLPVVVGVVVASPAWVSYLDYLPQPVRSAGFTHEGATRWSWHPATAIEGLLPGAFGEQTLRRFDGRTGFWAAELVPEKGYPLFAGTYVGAMVIALAITGFSGTGYRRWLLPTWLVVLALLALGRYGPLSMLYTMPGFNSLRYPVKWLLPAGFPLALLAGRGVDRVERSSASVGRPALLHHLLLATAAVAALAAMTQLPFVVEQLGGPRIMRFLSAVRATLLAATLRGLLPLVVACGIAFFGLARPAPNSKVERQRARWTASLLALLVGVDLVQANARLAPTAGAEFYDRVPEIVRAIASDPEGSLRVHVAKPRDVQFRRDPTYAEQARGQRERLVGYTALAYGIDLAFGPDTEALHPLRYTRLQVMVASAPVRERWMLLGAAGATHLVTHDRPEYPGARLLAELPRRSAPPLGVWRNPLAVSRARMVSRLVCYDGDEEFIAVVSGAPDDLFLNAALVEVGDLKAAGLDRDACGPIPAHGTDTAATSVVAIEDRGDLLRIDTRGPAGWLVVNDTWLAGWSARVDGQTAPLIRVDYTFRGVPLPPGEHEVVMTYDSW